MALVDVDEVLVDPAVGLRAVGVEGLLVLPAADVLHVADAAALDLGAAVAEALGQPGLPHVRRLDDVVVDADDRGQLPGSGGGRSSQGLHLGSDGVSDTLPGHLTGRQIGSAAMPLDLAALVAPAHTAVVTSEVQNGVVGARSALPALAEAAAAEMLPSLGRLLPGRPGGRRAGGALHRLPAGRRQGRQHQRPAVHGRAQVAGARCCPAPPRSRCVAELGPEPERPRAHPHPRARPDGGHRPRPGAAQPRRAHDRGHRRVGERRRHQPGDGRGEPRLRRGAAARRGVRHPAGLRRRRDRQHARPARRHHDHRRPARDLDVA